MGKAAKQQSAAIAVEPLLPTDTVQIFNIDRDDQQTFEVLCAFIENSDTSGINTPDPVLKTEWREDPNRLLVQFFDFHGLLYSSFFY